MMGTSFHWKSSARGLCGVAEEVTKKMPIDNLNNWNTLIHDAFKGGNAEICFFYFGKMRMQRLEPNSLTVVNLLRASTVLNSLYAGRMVHLLIVLFSLSYNLSVNTALLTMYLKLGSLETAALLFERMPEKDCVVWNILISAYSQKGYPNEALKLLVQMVKSGTRPDLFTAIAIISSIAELQALQLGRQVHAHVIRNGSDHQASVHNCLIDMYGKCGELEIAMKIFDSMLNKTVVSWSSMIKVYVRNDRCSDALYLFTKMKLYGTRPDSVTIINILPACVDAGVLEQVKYLHGHAIKDGLNLTVSVVTAFLICYSRCGCIEMAQKLFDEEKVDCKDIFSWNSMISAYSKHGDWSQCFSLYGRMKRLKLRPDHVTFLGLLTACVNSGFVEKGWECFKEMEKYDCKPNQEHYACMVDLLGRTGHANEAFGLVRSMPFEPDARIWGPLLSACKTNSETELAEFAAEKLINMEPKNAGNYVLLSNIYAAAGKWDGVAKMRSVLRDRGLKKTPGCSWIEINGRVHEFRVAHQSHPELEDIYATLASLKMVFKLERKMISETVS
ncbi:hypothetical protein Syun_028256 [Stephania yunnanensis]|uniref:Pentatricopeptide repeat-containing protein n=1 Tax=Stephania yunnanensis TaxID=152371 RepID=A0AAP0HRY7_9MAGN